jgi:hypothetical protein
MQLTANAYIDPLLRNDNSLNPCFDAFALGVADGETHQNKGSMGKGDLSLRTQGREPPGLQNGIFSPARSEAISRRTIQVTYIKGDCFSRFTNYCQVGELTRSFAMTIR